MALATQTLSTKHTRSTEAATLGGSPRCPSGCWRRSAQAGRRRAGAPRPELRDGTIELRWLQGQAAAPERRQRALDRRLHADDRRAASGQKQTVALEGRAGRRRICARPAARPELAPGFWEQAAGAARCPSLGLSWRPSRLRGPSDAACRSRTRPGAARALLEQAIGAGAAYGDLRIASCAPNGLEL